MSRRVVCGLIAFFVSMAACVFVAGDINPFNWEAAGRAFTVIISLVAFVMTATCPFIDEVLE
jgi:FtsH-binding integral membrane protein